MGIHRDTQQGIENMKESPARVETAKLTIQYRQER
jgi:hypothetical protein